MRLSEQEASDIRAAVRSVFGEMASIRLFGSRTDDRARGGDIDLYVEVPATACSLSKEISLRVELLKRLGERRIDVVLRPFGGHDEAIDRIVAETGVRL